MAIGRTDKPQDLSRFAQALASQLNVELINLRWLETTDIVTPLDVKLFELSHCYAVMTDIYHLCVSAWRDGIPCLCFGNGTDDRIGPLCDEKKFIFHCAYNMQYCYFYTEGLLNESQFASYLVRAKDILNNVGNLFSPAYSMLKKDVARAEAEIVDFLSD